MIIGLTGKMAAGKGTVAEYLKSQGFIYHSCSDVLRHELVKRKKTETIPNLMAMGNQLRAKEGPGVLAKILLKEIQKNKEANTIVDSIRNPAEVEELAKTKDKFILMAVDAEMGLRYKRVCQRSRQGDAMTLVEFEEQDIRQLKSEDPNGQQILACFKLADYTIVNDGTMAELQKKIDDILIDLKIKQ